jgi:Protein of unknown function (DUF2752)
LERLKKLWQHNLLVAACLFGVAGLVMLWVFDPATSGVFPPCPVRYLTGFYCPGCGSLRALHALLHGDLRRAWAMNPFAVTVLPFLCYGLASEILLALRGRGLPQVTLPANWIRAFGIAVVLYGIARNLPVHPFNLLAPGALLHP